MKKAFVIDFGLVALAILSAGVLGLQSQAYAVPAPVTCTNECSETKYNKLCSSGVYLYFTKETCSLCGAAAGTWNCTDRKTPGMCLAVSEKMKGKPITSMEACPCTVDTFTYDYVEASPIDAGTVTADDIDRLRCYV